MCQNCAFSRGHHLQLKITNCPGNCILQPTVTFPSCLQGRFGQIFACEGILALVNRLGVWTSPVYPVSITVQIIPEDDISYPGTRGISY